MQHLYRTCKDLRLEHPACADTDPAHPMKSDSVCARCHSVLAHQLQDQIVSLQNQIRQQDAEIYRLRIAGKPRL